MERLTDAAHCLRLREARQIESLLDDFQQHFPQVYPAIFLSVLPARLNVRELSFWLLNRAAFGGSDQRRLNEYAVLLAIDPVAKTAAFTVGYALEAALPEHRLAKILHAMRPSLWHGEYAEAIKQGIVAVEKRLRKAASCVRQAEEISPPESYENFLDDTGPRLLRSQQEHSLKSIISSDGDPV